MAIAPLPNKPLLRDLVTDIAPPKARTATDPEAGKREVVSSESPPASATVGGILHQPPFGPDHPFRHRRRGALCGGKDDAEQIALENFLSLFRIVPVCGAIAKLGGLYEHDYGPSHGIGLADAVVAATAAMEDAELKTLNIKHCPMFKSIEPAYRR